MALPDLVGALIAQTRIKTATNTLTQGRITGGRARTASASDPNGWQMPTYGVVYVIVGGPVIARYRVPITSQNIQVECYGPDLRTAALLYRTWYTDFYPADSHVSQGFIAAQCSVMSLQQMGASIALYGAENVWPRVVSTHMIRFCEVPVPQLGPL